MQPNFVAYATKFGNPCASWDPGLAASWAELQAGGADSLYSQNWQAHAFRLEFQQAFNLPKSS